ncbi:MAG TPA: FAD-dependent oxidoreductase [Candidatus Binataceae bacterium]|nr:FAD-dependent oxidoreductase [Candidatus Binataceae bacterium]
MKDSPRVDLSVLYQPIALNKLNLKNRIVMAPMCSRLPTPEGEVTQAMLDHYRERARGGAAMLIIEFARVDDNASSAEWNMLSASSDRFSVGLSLLAETIKLYGARACLQLAHAGRQSSYAEPCLAPSAIPDLMYQALMGSRYQVREITPNEIHQVIESFANAALRAKNAGFDAVEIHGAHGYLITGFMSPYSNHRSDEFGGTFENRMRFPLAIVRRCRELVGPRFPLLFRYNADDGVPKGITLDEAIRFAQMLEAAGIDAHHVTASIGESWELCEPPIYVARGSLVHLAEAVKKVAKKPVIAVGGIDVPLAAEVVRSGKADIIAMGRAFLADPYFPGKGASEDIRSIRPCIRCNESCLNGEMTARPQRCDVNFLCGRETNYPMTPAIVKRRVVVIGGGAAGMEAARVAKLRGHDVVLFEKSSGLGGQLNLAALLGFKEDLRTLMNNLAYQIEQAGIDIRMNCEATKERIAELKPDALIVACGVESIIRDVAGVELPHVAFPVDLLEMKANAGNRVIVVGGGWLGCDISVFLARLGKEVILTTKKGSTDDLIPELEPFTRKVFINMMESAGVKVRGQHQLVEITKRGAVFDVAGSESVEIGADTVVPAWGFRPNRQFNELAAGLAPYHRFVGDCVRLANLRESIWPGFLAAYEC